MPESPVLSTPEEKCIGAPEEKCIRGEGRWVAVWSVPAKPFGRIDCLEIGQVEFTDRAECVSGSTVLKVVRQGLQPCGILCL